MHGNEELRGHLKIREDILVTANYKYMEEGFEN